MNEELKTVMHAVGQLAARVYGHDVPADVQVQLLTHPLTGIGLMSRSKEFIAKAKQEDIGLIIDKIPADFEQNKGGVANEYQMHYWLGYYSYLRAIAKSQEFDKDKLAACATALYGERWQSELAEALNINSRRVREWVSGERLIPVGIVAELLALLKQRQIKIDDIIESLTK